MKTEGGPPTLQGLRAAVLPAIWGTTHGTTAAWGNCGHFQANCEGSSRGLAQASTSHTSFSTLPKEQLAGW